MKVPETSFWGHNENLDNGGSNYRDLTVSDLSVLSHFDDILAVTTDDIIEGEQSMKRRGLSTALWGRVAVVCADELLYVREVRFKPGGASASDVEGSFQTGEMNGIVNGVESCTEVEEAKDVE